MTIKIPTQKIIVGASGRGQPEIGKPFDFTDAELADIERMSPSAVRDPVNEGGDTPAKPAKGGKVGKGEAGAGEAGTGEGGESL